MNLHVAHTTLSCRSATLSRVPFRKLLHCSSQRAKQLEGLLATQRRSVSTGFGAVGSLRELGESSDLLATLYGSSPHGPTIFFNHLAKTSENFTCNSSPVKWLDLRRSGQRKLAAALCVRGSSRDNGLTGSTKKCLLSGASLAWCPVRLILGCTQLVCHRIDDVLDTDANAKSGETLGIGRAIGPFP